MLRKLSMGNQCKISRKICKATFENIDLFTTIHQIKEYDFVVFLPPSIFAKTLMINASLSISSLYPVFHTSRSTAFAVVSLMQTSRCSNSRNRRSLPQGVYDFEYQGSRSDAANHSRLVDGGVCPARKYASFVYKHLLLTATITIMKNTDTAISGIGVICLYCVLALNCG